MSEIATKVKAIIVDKLGVDEKDVTLEASYLTSRFPMKRLKRLSPSVTPSPSLKTLRNN